MEELLKYYMLETNVRLSGIEVSLKDLQKFKAEMLVSARITALIVSAACGFLTLLSSIGLTYFTLRAHP